MSSDFNPENAEGTIYTRSQYERRIYIGDRKLELVRSIASGLAGRVLAVDKQTFEAEGDAFARSFASGVASARQRVADAAFRRHYVAAFIAVGYSLRSSRVTGVAPSVERVSNRFVAEIDALERAEEPKSEQSSGNSKTRSKEKRINPRRVRPNDHLPTIKLTENNREEIVSDSERALGLRTPLTPEHHVAVV